MSYKRLTKWETSKGVKCVKYWQYSQEQIAERLALLEDKIENGTLVELPCKVGDTVYEVIKDLPIQEWEITGIVYGRCYGKNYVITAERKRDFAGWKFWREDFGKTIFLTKAEAEKKLKELSKNR